MSESACKDEQKPSAVREDSEQEELRLAALAIGIEVEWLDGHPFGKCMFRKTGQSFPYSTKVPWRPYSDSDDALNLMARLRMEVSWTFRNMVVIHIGMPHERDVVSVTREYSSSRNRFIDGVEKCIRYAVVQAAAEYGRRIEQLGYVPRY